MHTGRPPHCIKARCSAFFQVPKNAHTKAPVRSSRPQKPHTGFPTAHKCVLPGPQNAHRSPTLHKGPKLFSSSVWNGMPLDALVSPCGKHETYISQIARSPATPVHEVRGHLITHAGILHANRNPASKLGSSGWKMQCCGFQNAGFTCRVPMPPRFLKP